MLIIGEKINATIPRVREAILNHDEEFLVKLAVDQEAAGAGLVDLNVGTGEGTAEDEVRNMKWLVGLVMDKVKCGLCIDSDNPFVLEAGIEAAGERTGMVNSVKATEKNLAEVLPLVASRGLPVIGLAMDEAGIPRDSDARVRAAGRILEAAEKLGVPREKVYIDPLVMPVSTDITQGKVTLDTLRDFKATYAGARSVLAVSNVSFGLPNRALINSSLVLMAMRNDVDALLVNPMDRKLMGSVLAGDALLGRDRHCRKYARAARQGKI